MITLALLLRDLECIFVFRNAGNMMQFGRIVCFVFALVDRDAGSIALFLPAWHGFALGTLCR